MNENQFMNNQQYTYNYISGVVDNYEVTNPNMNNKIFIKPHKVLINPNFRKPNVYINPHFNAGYNTKIHVNPKLINNKIHVNSLFQTVKTVPVQENLQSGPNIFSSTHSSNSSKSVGSVSPSISFVKKRRLSIQSKYKIVKSSLSINKQTEIRSISPRTRKTSIRSKYKIEKCLPNPITKNKYKIDRRTINTINKSFTKRKVLSQSISDLMRNNIIKTNWKKSLIVNQFKSSNSTRLTNISGCLYKKSLTKLQKISPNRNKKISGEKKYQITKNKKSLMLIKTPNRAIKKSPKKLRSPTLQNISRKQKLSQDRNKLRKNNQPCPVYRRYGKCRRKEAGRCMFLHNPNQIFLCKKFLQGACVDNDCLLSHKVSQEKMPTCKYFLEGCCVRNVCPYLHVKINPKADICRKFLEGYCDKGSQCNLRHQFLCPNFERGEKCLKRKCLYPHKQKSEKEKNNIKTEKVKSSVLINKKEVDFSEKSRYYVEPKNDGNCSSDLENQVTGIHSSSNERIYDRPQLGVLPSFIPF